MNCTAQTYVSYTEKNSITVNYNCLSNLSKFTITNQSIVITITV